MVKMQPVHVLRTLPVVLNCAEVSRLIMAAPSLKYQTALSIAYGAGLRASEVVWLRVSDIDSGCMILRIECGKGQKDRHAMLSPLLLAAFGCDGGLPAPPQMRQRSTNAFRCTRSGIVLPPICWSRRPISGLSRSCLAIKSWKRPRVIPMSPPRYCVR